MNCELCQKNMEEYWGEPLVSLPAELQEHLSHCTLCLNEWQEMQALLDFMKSDVLQEPEDLFWQKQRISILQKVRQKSVFFNFPRWSLLLPVLFILMLVFYQFRQHSTQQLSQPEVAWSLEDEEIEVEVMDLDEQEEEIYVSYLSQKTDDFEEDSSVEDTIEELNLEQLQKAIQFFEQDNRRSYEKHI